MKTESITGFNEPPTKGAIVRGTRLRAKSCIGYCISANTLLTESVMIISVTKDKKFIPSRMTSGTSRAPGLAAGQGLAR